MHLIHLNCKALIASANPKVLLCDFLGCILRTKSHSVPSWFLHKDLLLEAVAKEKKKKEEDKGVNWGSEAQSSPHIGQNPEESVSSPCFALSFLSLLLEFKTVPTSPSGWDIFSKVQKRQQNAPAALHNQAQRTSCIRLCCQAHFTPSRNQIRVETWMLIRVFSHKLRIEMICF